MNLIKENEDLKKIINDLKESLMNNDKDKKQMEMHLLQLTMAIDNQKMEIEKLKEILEEKKKERDHLADQVKKVY